MFRIKEYFEKTLNVLFKLINYVYPFLSIFVFILLIIELFSYRGFIRNFLFFNSVHFLIFFIILGLFLLYGWITRKIALSIEMNALLSFNLLLFPSLLFLEYLIQQLEFQHYPNYVFSQFHLNPTFFLNIIWYSGFLLFLKGAHFDYKKLKKPKLFAIGHKEFILVFLILCACFFHFFTHFPYIVQKILSASFYILNNPLATYDEKMTYEWGMVYQYALFVKNNTPDDAKIYIPPQLNPWLTEGNTSVMRYFLYPRTLKQGLTPEQSDWEDDTTYLFIAKGSWGADREEDYGWPKINIPATEIFIWNEETEEVTTYSNVEYDPNDLRFSKKWGLIKLQ